MIPTLLLTVGFLMKYVNQSLVVALFNAIAKTKKEAAEREAAEKSKDKTEGWLLFYVLI